jgi:deazaflavin-dependent oxidoreductase (nitroreductase family)
MPSDLAFKAINRVVRSVQTLTGGQLGWRASSMPVLRLTTTGRRSGLPRTVVLTSPLTEGDALVVVASRGGDDRPPDWLLNLQANPTVEVVLRDGPPRQLRARVATEQERERLWPRVVADHRNYADYQARTTRVIQLVLLEPPA